MVNGAKASLRIDLNMLDGNRIVTPASFAVGGFIPALAVGDLVEAIEAEGDRYLARIDGFSAGGKLIQLSINLDSWLPKIEDSVPSERILPGIVEPRVSGSLVASGY